jgi:hypothetical protein
MPTYLWVKLGMLMSALGGAAGTGSAFVIVYQGDEQPSTFEGEPISSPGVPRRRETR